MARSSAENPPSRPNQGARAAPHDRPWWETRWMVALAIAAATIPLAYPSIPPLVDLLGHMGRYRVELGHSPLLDRYFEFRWQAIGNLGVDLIVLALAPLMGLEPAVKLIIIAIPALTVAGFLWVAREVHGRIPPTAYLAIPFAYGQPFLFGFVNFALSMAMAFFAFGLWLRMARKGQLKSRELLFVPISIVIFFTHAYGWGALGLLCFSAEAVRLHDQGQSWWKAGLNAAVHASVMALPLLIMIVWRNDGSQGDTSDWFNWHAKWVWLKGTLRDRWQVFDIASLAAVSLVLAEAVRNRRLTYSRNLLFSGLVLTAGFIFLPRIVFGSAYADMRLLPYIFAVLFIAIRFRGETDRRLGQLLMIIALLFVGIRLTGNSISLAKAAHDQESKLPALDHVPLGSRVLSFTTLPCGIVWELPRNGHLGAMAIVRRQGFSNDQWVMEGLNLMELRYRQPGFFAADPSQIVRPNGCGDRLHLTIDQSLRYFPRDGFDYVWLIGVPEFDHSLIADLTPVWRSGNSILYRVRP